MDQTVKGALDALRAEMATKRELAAVRAEMATKRDLEAMRAEMATKRELEDMRAEMATKRELYAMRDELSGAITRIAVEQVRMRAEMATKADVQGLLKEFRKMYRVALEASERARSSFEKMLAHGDILQSHEARIARLEKKAA